MIRNSARLIGVSLTALPLALHPAQANFTVTQGSGTTIFSFDTATGGTSNCGANECYADVMVNTAGAPIGVSGTPWYVTGSGGTFPVTGTFWQATQPISAASLPLPTGAATAAGLTTINSTLGSPFQAGGSIGNTTFAATQATAASLNATVVGTGTFATQLTGSTNNINNISGTVSLPTGAATSANQTNASQKTQIVDGSGNVIASTSNNLDVQCANCSGSGVSTADGASWTVGTSLFAGVGGFYQTTPTSNPLTTGHQGFAQLTPYRSLFTDWYNSSGVEMGTSTTPVQVSLANTGANATAVAVTANAGTNLNTSLLALETGGNLATTATNTGTVAGAVTSSVMQENVKQVNGVTALAGAGATGTGSQRVTAAQDTTTIAGSAPGTAGSASTNVVSVQGITSMTPLLANPGTAANWALFADSAAWTAGTTLHVPMGCEYTSGGATALTTAHVGTPGCTSARQQFVALFGNTGAAMDVAVGGAAAAANALQAGGVYNSSAPTLTAGQGAALQLTATGSLHATVDNALSAVAWSADGVSNATTGSPTTSLLMASNGSTVDRLQDDANKSLKIAQQATPAGGALSSPWLASAASNNATNVKNAAGTLYSVTVTQSTTTAMELKLYNTSTSPTCSSATGLVDIIPLPSNATNPGFHLPYPVGRAFSTGISFCLVAFGNPAAGTDNGNAVTGATVSMTYD